MSADSPCANQRRDVGGASVESRALHRMEMYRCRDSHTQAVLAASRIYLGVHAPKGREHTRAYDVCMVPPKLLTDLQRVPALHHKPNTTGPKD